MICLILIFLATFLYFVPNKKPYAGVYTRPGKWYYFKAAFIYLTIKLRKWSAKRKDSSNETKSTSSRNETAGYGVKSEVDVASMEKAQPLSDHPLAIDAVLFSCAGQDGSYMVAAEARRKLKMNNTIFCLRIPEVGVLLHPKHPDTTFFTESETSWDAEGLKLDLITPMKRWGISYQGVMIHQTTGKTHQVNLKAEYTSDLPYFDFDSDMNEWTAARAMAKEDWSRDYFEKIRKAHQCHYEQFGEVTGIVNIDGTDHKLNLNVMRDHTHGSTRDWRLMHRYGIQNFTTKTGFRGFIGVVSQPSTFSSLELGYVYTPQGQCHAVEAVDLPLWQHGENGADPKDFGFRFKAGGEWHEVQIRVLNTVEVFIGWQWEARILERFCEYTVDGVPGWGVSEWHYRNHHGRPENLTKNDPEYTKKFEKY